jgi:asparagine synthase (glutamine-hydrolysing)
MCGIVALIDRRGGRVSAETVRAMAGTLAHRGPDGEGAYVREGVGLGQTRLSIVDIEGGAQPMATADGRFVIVFNGEIYNYRELRKTLEGKGHAFRTQSDTEVLLLAYAEWGAGCLKKLRGMFAFVVLDTASGAVFAARDRIGIKPLFWYASDRVVVFASEMKAILASGHHAGTLDFCSVQDLMMFGHTLPPHTPFRGIREVWPGGTVRVSDGRVEEGRYWSMPVGRPAAGVSDADAGKMKGELHDRLRGSVESHLIGDVPIACYLSGGIDSNSVAWMLKELAFPVARTYSMTFDDEELDESQDIERAAADLGLPNRSLALGPETLRNYSDVIYHLEQPQWWTIDPAFHALAGAVHADGIKVTLSGQGSDEQLAGYHVFRMDQVRAKLSRLPWRLVRGPLLRMALKKNNAPEDVSRYTVGMMQRSARKVRAEYGLWPSRLMEWMILEPMVAGTLSDAVLETQADAAQRQRAFFDDEIRPNVKGADELSASLYLEMRTRLPAFILWKEDRMNMAHGVETRPPFLDHELVEFCAGLPADVKLRGQQDKWLLRQAMRGKLKGAQVKRPKKPFFAPVSSWIRDAANAEMIRETLKADRLEAAGLFDPTVIGAAVDTALEGETSSPPTLQQMRAEWVTMFALGYQLLVDRLVNELPRASGPDNG